MQLSDDFYRDGRSTLQVKSSFFSFLFWKGFSKVCFCVRINNSYRAPSGNPLAASQTVGSVCDRDADQFSVTPAPNTGELLFLFCPRCFCLFTIFVKNVRLQKKQKATTTLASFATCLQRTSCWFHLFRKQLVWSAATSPRSRCTTCWTQRKVSLPCSIRTTSSSWTVAVQRGLWATSNLAILSFFCRAEC